MRVFSLAVISDRVNGVSIGLDGFDRSISSSNSWIAFSATGFLLTFLERPNSIVIRCLANSSSLTNVLNEDAGSVLITAYGPSRG